MNKPKMAIIVNLAADISFGRMVAQACHAAVLSLLERGSYDEVTHLFIIKCDWDMKLIEWITESFTKVVFRAWGNAQIEDIIEKAKQLGIHYSIMTEPDLPGVITAVSLGPDSEKLDGITKDLLLL